MVALYCQPVAFFCQSVCFMALLNLWGKMSIWNTLQKIPILMKILAFLLPVQIANLMPWGLFPGGQACFLLQAH